MKTKTYNFNTKITQEEHNLILELKNKYAVNLSMAFRLFIREYYNKMKEFDNGKGK